ncbi:hypothetical protein Hanom_Chr12g01103981 [Helianthus anomalus]
MRGPPFHSHQHFQKKTCSLSLFPYLRPNTTSIIPSSFKFDLAKPLTYKGEKSHTRRLGAFGISKTSLPHFYPPSCRFDSSLALS